MTKSAGTAHRRSWVSPPSEAVVRKGAGGQKKEEGDQPVAPVLAVVRTVTTREVVR